MISQGTTRTLDVPHVFRDGGMDLDTGETWFLFWRNATCFKVDLNQREIEKTTFWPEWGMCVQEALMAIDPGHRSQRYDEMCDCLLRKILPTLQELAPTECAREWMTLEDYITTPKYELRLVKDESTGDAVAKVMNGPTIHPAFGITPQPLSRLQLPQDFPHIPASELIPIDPDPYLRNEPSRVLKINTDLTTGFSRATTYSYQGENMWLATMHVLLRLCTLPKPINMFTPLALVTTTFTLPANAEEGPTRAEADLKIAGMLHTDMPETTKRLNDPESIQLAVSHPELVLQWKSELEGILQTLHSLDIVHGYINPDSIYIDHLAVSKSLENPGSHGVGSVWLMPPVLPPPYHLYTDGSKRGTQDGDWQLLTHNFNWLQFETRKAKGELREDEGKVWLPPGPI